MGRREDGIIPSRALTGILLRRDTDAALNAGADKMFWGIVASPTGLEFLCPDRSINQPLLPISPNVCLVGGFADIPASAFTTGDINRALINGAKSYWFAQDLKKCPILNRANIINP